jgi:hypothetical protein
VDTPAGGVSLATVDRKIFSLDGGLCKGSVPLARITALCASGGATKTGSPSHLWIGLESVALENP